MKSITLCFVAILVGGIASGADADTENRIIGGNETTIETYPYQVSLQRHGYHICGGAAITDSIALTAAHCLLYPDAPWQYSIMAGATLIEGDGNEQVRPLSRLLRHPRFHTNPATNDVSLLYWELPLELGVNFLPIALPLQDEPVPYGHDCNVTGWGRIGEGIDAPLSERLKVVTLPLISNEECQEIFGDVITDVMLCAGAPEGGRDSCTGDSGSPLVVDGVQFGVVSFGRGCARPNTPGIYARVASFVDWIDANIE